MGGINSKSPGLITLSDVVLPGCIGLSDFSPMRLGSSPSRDYHQPRSQRCRRRFVKKPHLNLWMCLPREGHGSVLCTVPRGRPWTWPCWTAPWMSFEVSPWLKRLIFTLKLLLKIIIILNFRWFFNAKKRLRENKSEILPWLYGKHRSLMLLTSYKNIAKNGKKRFSNFRVGYIRVGYRAGTVDRIRRTE